MTTIRYGMEGEVRKDFGNKTIGELLADNNLLAFLGAPDGSGLVAISNGNILSPEDYVNDYDEIQLEKKASEKAAV